MVEPFPITLQILPVAAAVASLQLEEMDQQTHLVMAAVDTQHR